MQRDEVGRSRDLIQLVTLFAIVDDAVRRLVRRPADDGRGAVDVADDQVADRRRGLVDRDLDGEQSDARTRDAARMGHDDVGRSRLRTRGVALCLTLPVRVAADVLADPSVTFQHERAGHGLIQKRPVVADEEQRAVECGE